MVTIKEEKAVKRMWLLILAVALLAGLTLAGEAKTLRWNLSTEPPSLDPSLATDTTSHQVLKAMFISLCQFDDNTMAVLPDLAKTWDFDAATNTWTFHLRNDVYWVDQTALPLGVVTAHDVVYGIKRLLAPETASEYAYVLYLIKGAEAYNTGAGGADGVGVVALDDFTVAITLNFPAGYFPSMAALWLCAPLPGAAIERYGDQWTEAKYIQSNGPYLLGEWVHEDHLVLVKNPNYYDAGNVKIDEIYCTMVNEQSTAMAMYEAGDLDVNDNPPLEDMDRIKTDPVLSLELKQAPRLCTYRYGFNAAKAPLDNILVRKALASSVDRQTLIDYVLKGNQRPAQTWTPPGIYGYVDGVSEGIGYPFDPEAARQYLADAGYPGGAGFPEVTIMINTSQGHQKIAEFIAQGWKDTLGIKVNITNQEWGVYLNTCSTDAPQVFRMGWCADYPDANNWMNDVFHSGSGNNYEKYDSAVFDDLVERAAVSTDPAERLALYREAEVLICETDVAFIPIYFYTFNQLTKPYVVRTFSAIGGESWKNWDILDQ
jgi:oligopeptide transport system substrate-binding protein